LAVTIISHLVERFIYSSKVGNWCVDVTDRVYFLCFLGEASFCNGSLNLPEENLNKIDVNTVIDLVPAIKLGSMAESLLVGGGSYPLCIGSKEKVGRMHELLRFNYSSLGLLQSVNDLHVFSLSLLSQTDQLRIQSESVSPDEINELFCI